MGARLPKVSRPKLDLSAVGRKFNNSIFQEAMIGNNPDLKTYRSAEDARGEIEQVHQGAAAASLPKKSAPEETGLGEVDFYPIKFDPGDGTVPAEIGKTTNLDFATALYGKERALQQATNLFTRNRPGTDHQGIFPSIGPSAKEHFGRPIYVVRTDTPSDSNGHYHPLFGVGSWSKADDLRRGLVEHEIGGHGTTAFSPFKEGLLGRDIPAGKGSESHWGFPTTTEDGETLRDLIAALTAISDRKGTKVSRFGWLHNKILDEDAADELNQQMLTGYHFTPPEMLANSHNWKNQALQVRGEELATGGRQKEIDQMRSFLEAAPTASPRFQAGPRKGMDADNFNFLDIQQKAIYTFLKSTNPEKAKQYLEMLYRLGAVAAPVALPLLDEKNDPRGN
jgi:hypothetical protein